MVVVAVVGIVKHASMPESASPSLILQHLVGPLQPLELGLGLDVTGRGTGSQLLLLGPLGGHIGEVGQVSARHDTARHGTARHGTARHGTGWCSKATNIRRVRQVGEGESESESIRIANRGRSW